MKDEPQACISSGSLRYTAEASEESGWHLRRPPLQGPLPPASTTSHLPGLAARKGAPTLHAAVRREKSKAVSAARFTQTTERRPRCPCLAEHECSKLGGSAGLDADDAAAKQSFRMWKTKDHDNDVPCRRAHQQDCKERRKASDSEIRSPYGTKNASERVFRKCLNLFEKQNYDEISSMASYSMNQLSIVVEVIHDAEHPAEGNFRAP